jgi:hypothetical protein
MSKKNKLKKIHLYIIIGVSVLIIGVLIWGFATKWKFFGSDDNNNQKLQSALNKLTKSYQDAKEKLENLNDILRQKKELETELSEIKKDVSLSGDKKLQKIRKLEQGIEDKNKEIEDKNKEIERVTENTKNKVNTVQIELDKTRQRLRELDSAKIDASKKLKEAEEKIGKLELEKKSLSQSGARLLLRAEKAERDKEQAQQRLKYLDSTKATVSEQLKVAKAKINKLQNTNAILESNIRKLQAQLLGKNTKFDKREKELLGTIKDYLRETVKLKLQIQNLKSQTPNKETDECYTVVLTILQGECRGENKDLLNDLMKCRQDINWYSSYGVIDGDKNYGDCPNTCPHDLYNYVKLKASATEAQRTKFAKYTKKSKSYKKPQKIYVYCNNWDKIKDFSEVDYSVPLTNRSQTHNCDVSAYRSSANSQWVYLKPNSGTTRQQMLDAGAMESAEYTSPQLYYIYCNNFFKVRKIAYIYDKPNTSTNYVTSCGDSADMCISERHEPGVTGQYNCAKVALAKGYSGFTIKDSDNKCYLEQPCNEQKLLDKKNGQRRGKVGYSNYVLKEDKTNCISKTRTYVKSKNILSNANLSADILSKCFNTGDDLLIKISVNSDYTKPALDTTKVSKNNAFPKWNDTFRITNLRKNDNLYLHLFEIDTSKTTTDYKIYDKIDRFVATKKISFEEIKKSKKSEQTNDFLTVTEKCGAKDAITGCGQISFNYKSSLQCVHPPRMLN